VPFLFIWNIWIALNELLHVSMRALFSLADLVPYCFSPILYYEC
jgi:hypothetical protein